MGWARGRIGWSRQGLLAAMSCWAFGSISGEACGQASAGTAGAGAPAARAVEPASGDAEQSRSYAELDSDVRAALQQHAVAKSDRAHANAVARLAELYCELKHDPRQEYSETIRGMKIRLWSRLNRARRAIIRELARRDAASAGATGEPPGRKLSADRASRAGGTSRLAGAELTQAQEAWAGEAQSWATHLELSASLLGGPGGWMNLAAGAGGAAVAPDFGPDLVALIERTIAPDFWDVNGGPGTIMYYRPLHALVVRASGEVHRKLGGVLDGLRGGR